MKIAIVISLLFLSGCVTSDAPEPSDDPFPSDYRALIVAHKSDIFKDAESVKDASVSAPKRGSGPYLSPSGFVTPWIVCVIANAKNSFGAYTGKQLTAVLISRGAFLEAKAEASWCTDHKSYEPFPELTQAVVRR